MSLAMTTWPIEALLESNTIVLGTVAFTPNVEDGELQWEALVDLPDAGLSGWSDFRYTDRQVAHLIYQDAALYVDSSAFAGGLRAAVVIQRRSGYVITTPARAQFEWQD